MLTAQICSLNEFPAWLSKLNVPENDFPEFAHGCRMSKGMRWMDSDIKHGNPVFIGVGQAILVLVVACIAVDGNFGVLGHHAIEFGVGLTHPIGSCSQLSLTAHWCQRIPLMSRDIGASHMQIA